MEFCEEMANLGKTVIVAALDGTFQRKVIVLVYLDKWIHCSYCRARQNSTLDRTQCAAQDAFFLKSWTITDHSVFLSHNIMHLFCF